jgi:hypothetical protein
MDVSTHNTQTFLPGDRIVLCHEGGVFRTVLVVGGGGSAEAPVTYDGRGSAVFAASNAVIRWIPTGGNVYSADYPVQPQQVFFDGRFGDRKNGVVGLVDEYDWFWSSNVLYVYSPGDPAARYAGRGVEAGARTRCIRVAGDYVTVEGLTAMHSIEHNVIAYNSTGVTFSNLTSEWAWELGIVISGNTFQRDNTIRNCVARFNGGGGISSAFNRSGRMANHTYLRNTCYENGRHQFAVPLWTPRHQFTFGIKLWGNHLSSTGVVIAENRCYDNGPSGPMINNSQKGNGIWIDEIDGSVGSPIIIRHNLIHNNAGSGVFLENSSLNDVYSNVLHGNSLGSAVLDPYAAGGVKLLARQSYDTSRNNISNNTIVGGWLGLQVTSYNQTAGLEISHNKFRNNIVVGSAGRVLRATDGGDNSAWGTKNSYENNCFGAEARDFIRWGSIDYDTYDAWEAEHGGSPASIEGDPELAGISWNDVYLTEDSNCRNAGLNLGSAYDGALLESSVWTDSVVVIDQDKHGDGWEVGAFVFSEGTTRQSGDRRMPEPQIRRSPDRR